MNGFKLKPWDFPGVPVADSGLPIQGANLGLILDQGTKKKKKIPQWRFKILCATIKTWGRQINIFL